MTGYTRKDTSNNIADGNIVNAADLDNEFDGVQAAFVAATGHTHDGTASEGAAITKIGPVQDVVVSIAAMYPKTTNTVDLGTSSLKYKDAFFAGNETVGGTLAVTGVATLTAQPILSSLTASQAVFTDASKGLVSNAITGTGNVVMSTSPTLVTPALGTPSSGVVTNLTGTASININGTVGATTANTGNFTTLGATGNVTLGDASTDTVTVNGYMGVGGAGTTNVGVRIRGTALIGATQIGAFSTITAASDAAAAVWGFLATPATTAAAFTVSNLAGFSATDATKGAGSTITNQHGLYIADQTQGTNNYGITSLVSSGTNKWNVYASGTAANYFAGNVGIGIVAPQTQLQIESPTGGTLRLSSSDTTVSAGESLGLIDWYSNDLSGSGTGVRAFINVVENDGGLGRQYDILFGTGAAVTATEKMRLTATGNLGIGTSSPTSTLSVTGTANVTGNVTLGDATTDTVQVNGYMGVGGAVTNASRAINIESSALTGVAQRGLHSNITGSVAATTLVAGISSFPKTAAASFTVTDVMAFQAGTVDKGAGSTITNQHGLYIADQTQGTNNYGITSLVSSGTNKWNVYASGTAQNYFAGNVGIGATTPAVKLDVKQSGTGWYEGIRVVRSTADTQRLVLGNTAGASWIASVDAAGGSNNVLAFGRSTDGTTFTESARIDSVGNVGIGTATPTAKLDVNGTVNVPLSSSYMATVLDRPSIRPSLLLDFANTRVLDPRITFTRASTATFYDNDTSAVAEQNLLFYSQVFDNAVWTKVSVTNTANTTTAPDGTTTAATLIEDTTTNRHGIWQLSSGGSATSFTFSFYAKANTRTWISLRVDGVTSFFNLSTGVLGTVGAGCTATIADVGSSWYRCTVTKTWTSNQNCWLQLATGDTVESYLGDGASNVYIWGAQLEQRSAATAYTPTTTAAITNYIPVLQTAASGVARFDCNPVTRESLGLLIEESRTNLLTYSEQFDNAAWTKTGGTVSVNAFIAPDGTQTADNFVEDTSTGVHNISRTPPTLSGVNTFSFYIKPQGRTSLNITSDNQTIIPINSNVDLATGTVLTGNTKIDNVGNGVFRVACTTGVCTGATVIRIRLMSLDFSTSSYTGNGFSGIMVWGAQLEVGAFATSYIPTVASQVTRAADAASMTGTNFSSWYNGAQGSLYAEFFKSWTSSTATSPAQLSSPTVSQGVMSWINIDGVNTRQWVGTTATTIGSLSLTTSNKTAVSYGSSNAGSLNGAAVVANTGTFPSDINTLSVGKYGSGYLNGTIKRIAYYPLRLSNTELQGLTA